MGRSEKRARARICQRCGKEFQQAKAKQIYCSHECAWEAQKRPKRAVCRGCGKEFLVGRSCKGDYCGRECQWASMRKVRTCAYCGQEYDTTVSAGRYCSHACAKREFPRMGYAGQYVATAEWFGVLAGLIAERQERTRPCINCGRPFYNPYSRAKTCGAECARQYGNLRHERRIYRNGRPDLSISLRKVYDRAGGTCAGCGAKLTFDCDPNSGLYPSVDHIVPLAKGGLHRWGNVQLLCRACNSAKRDRTTEARQPQARLDGWGLRNAQGERDAVG